MGGNADSTTKISHCFWIIVKRLNNTKRKRKNEDPEGMILREYEIFSVNSYKR